MIDEFMKRTLNRMKCTIGDLEKQHEAMVAAFVEPDSCDQCKFYKQFNDTNDRGFYSCEKDASPLYRFARIDLACCRYFEGRIQEGGD